MGAPPTIPVARADQSYSSGMLWLLRHAEAADGFPDDDRPLTDRGTRQADAAGRALAPSFSLVLHDLTGVQARMRKGGLAGIAKGELVALLRPAELSAIAMADERVA